MYVTT